MVSYCKELLVLQTTNIVLILVVVDDGLVLVLAAVNASKTIAGLNPCCSGRWSRTIDYTRGMVNNVRVLILVVVDDGLVLDLIRHY